MPESIRATEPEGERWIIELAGKGLYRFRLRSVQEADIRPNALMAKIKIPDATPGLVSRYALNDEQALLAVLRYNRLIDTFLGITCYSLQNHLRTTVPGVGQVETDELYIGVDRAGTQYVIPVQAKGGRDRLSIVQIEQDIALCMDKYVNLVCRPVAAQFLGTDEIALFEFVTDDEGVHLMHEKHYKLVPAEDISADDLRRYSEQHGG